MKIFKFRKLRLLFEDREFREFKEFRTFLWKQFFPILSNCFQQAVATYPHGHVATLVF